MARASLTNTFSWALATSLLCAGACESVATPVKTPPPAAPKEEPPAPPVTPPAPAEPTPPGLSKIGELEYLEFTTAGADADSPLPMLVAIHGLGDDPKNFAKVFRGISVPARVIVPRAIDPYEPGWSWFPLRARDPDVEGLSKGMMRAADVLATSVEALAAQRPTTGKPIVTGFSQGGMLSFTLAAKHGHLFGAAVPISGWLPPPLWPTEETAKTVPPIVALHGTEDPALKYPKTVTCVDALSKRGVDATLLTYPGVAHVVTQEMRDEVYRRIAAALSKEATPSTPPPAANP